MVNAEAQPLYRRLLPHGGRVRPERARWQSRFLQFEPVAGTISGSPLQTPETPRAILTSARDRGQYRQAAGAIAAAVAAALSVAPLPHEK
jgi:hypothetical protein